MGHFNEWELDRTAEDERLDRLDGFTFAQELPRRTADTCEICGEAPACVTVRERGCDVRLCRPCFTSGWELNERHISPWAADFDDSYAQEWELLPGRSGTDTSVPDHYATIRTRFVFGDPERPGLFVAHLPPEEAAVSVAAHNRAVHAARISENPHPRIVCARSRIEAQQEGGA